MICSCHTLPILLSKLSELLILININSWQCVLNTAHALIHRNNINKVLLLLLLLVKVAQSCLTLWPHGIYSPWNSLVQNTRLEWVAFPFGSSQPRDHTQVSLICRWILYQLSHKGSPRTLEWVVYPFSSRSFWPRNWTRVYCIAGWFFTNWASGKPFYYLKNEKTALKIHIICPRSQSYQVAKTSIWAQAQNTWS